MALLPLYAAIAAVVWHVAMLGSGYVLQSNAAAAAARSYSIDASQSQALAAARETVPSYLAGSIDVAAGGSTVEVTMQIPGVVDGVPGIPSEVTSSRRVVREP